MTLLNYHPVKMNRWVNNLFDDVLDNDFNGGNFMSMPSVNIREKEDKYLIELAAPGMRKEDFNVDLTEHILTINAERQSETREGDENDSYARREFNYSSFTKQFTLPENITEELIEAKYENGILELTINKPEEELKSKEPKKIAIS